MKQNLDMLIRSLFVLQLLIIIQTTCMTFSARINTRERACEIINIEATLFFYYENMRINNQEKTDFILPRGLHL